MVKVIILVKKKHSDSINKLVEKIKRLKSNYINVFPPHAIITMLPEKSIPHFRNVKEVEFITSSVIDPAESLFSLPEKEEIISIWNKYVMADDETKRISSPGEELSWDSPGFQPPDPPYKLRKMMEMWEKELGQNMDGN